MKWKAIYRKRLEKLAKHLETGKLGHKFFDFSEYSFTDSEDGRKRNPYHCGTAGCALGECPVVFPKSWRFLKGDTPFFVRILPALPCEPKPLTNGRDRPFRSACRFFELSADEAEHLFYPNGQRPLRFGGRTLDQDATRKQVARNMRAFIKVKSQQV